MKLPQLEILNFEAEILMTAGGRQPAAEFFRAVAHGRKIFAIDRGIEICRACRIFLPAEKILSRCEL